MSGILKALGSRAIIGAFFKRLEELTAASWVNLIASPFSSNQESETYKWLSDAPPMELWKGPRNRRQLKDFGVTVVNEKYTAGLEIDEDDWRRDKTDQILVRVRELAVRAAQLPQKLLTTLLVNNANAYDGVALFHASSHKNLNNDTIVTASSVAAATGTTPTVDEMETAILQAIQYIQSYLDDAGEPRNEGATSFALMVPVVYWQALIGALRNTSRASGASNTLQSMNVNFVPLMNARLAAPYMYVFRTDSEVRTMIWQDEVPTQMAQLTEGSEFQILNDLRAYYVKRVCGAGVGRFDQAHRIQFT